MATARSTYWCDGCGAKSMRSAAPTPMSRPNTGSGTGLTPCCGRCRPEPCAVRRRRSRVHRRTRRCTRHWRAERRRAVGLRGLGQALGLGQRLELAQRVVFDLTDALPRDPKLATHLFEGPWLVAGEAEAELEHLALTLGQRVERTPDVGLAQRARGLIEWRWRRLVFDEI